MNIHEVNITTVTVDLTVIRVGNKQMTLSIFKQLPEYDGWYEEHGQNLPNTLQEGINLWGIIRYDYKHCTDWIIYEHEGILYKSGEAYALYGMGIRVPQLFIAA